MTGTRRSAIRVAMTALAIMILSASLQPASAAEGRSEASSYALSPTQKRYVKTNGYPEQFILLFITEEVDFQERIKRVLPQPRRIRGLAVFDEGAVCDLR